MADSPREVCNTSRRRCTPVHPHYSSATGSSCSCDSWHMTDRRVVTPTENEARHDKHDCQLKLTYLLSCIVSYLFSTGDKHVVWATVSNRWHHSATDITSRCRPFSILEVLATTTMTIHFRQCTFIFFHKRDNFLARHRPRV